MIIIIRFTGQRERGKNYKGARRRGHSQKNRGQGNNNNQYQWAYNNQTQSAYSQWLQKPPQQPSRVSTTDEINKNKRKIQVPYFVIFVVKITIVLLCIITGMIIMGLKMKYLKL